VDPFSLLFFDSFGLLFFLVLIIIRNFDFILLSIIFFLFTIIIIIISDFLGNLSQSSQVNREIDKFRVFFNKILDSAFFSEFLSILLEENDDLSSSAKSISSWVRCKSERVGSTTFPNPLGVIIETFGDDLDLLTSQKSGVKPDTKLPDQVEVTTLDGLDELSCT
jgi:hypothetical protein